MRMLNFSIWTFSNPTWLLSRSSTGLLNHKTTYSYALPLTKLTLSDKLQDLPCCCSLLSPQTPRDHSRLQRHVNPSTRVTCGIEVKEHKDANNRKNSLLYSSLDHHQFGKIFLVLPSEEELLVMLSPLLLKLGKLQSGSGRCCWGCPSAAGGLAVRRGWRALFITCPTCLWLDLIWPPRLISVTWSLLWSCGSLIDLCFMCSAQTHWTAYNVLDWDET